MSTLSAKKFATKKATSLIFNALVSNSNIPKICTVEGTIWVTNGYVAFAYPEKEFIFNLDLFNKFDGIKVVIEGARKNSILPCHVDSYRMERTHNIIQAKLTADGCEPVYVNKEFLDMFSSDCSFRRSAIPLQPVLVISPYGEERGIILPIRVNEKDAW